MPYKPHSGELPILICCCVLDVVLLLQFLRAANPKSNCPLDGSRKALHKAEGGVSQATLGPDSSADLLLLIHFLLRLQLR